MNRVPPLLVVALWITATAAVVGAQSAPQTPAQPASARSSIVEKIIVKVNGEILTQSELERMQIDTLQREQNAKVTKPRELSTDAGLTKALAEITPRLLVDTIDELLLVQFGKEQGIKFSDDNFKQAMENVKKENKLDDKQFVIALKEANLTMEQLRQNFERSYIRTQVERREIMKNLQLTEEEARQYYKAHPDEFMKPPTVTLREILVTVPTETVGGQPTINVAKDEAARDKITAIRARALKGEDFAALVTEASEAATKATGGIVGPMLVDDLAPAVSEAVLKLKPGEITEPLRLGNGYRIFKLEALTAAEVDAFDKLRNQIAQKIYDSRLGSETEKFLSKLRTQAVIEWKDDDYKRMFDQAQAKRAKSGL